MVVAPVLRFLDVGFNANVRIEVRFAVLHSKNLDPEPLNVPGQLSRY